MDETSDVQPAIDARLEEGSRVAAIPPPCSVDGPTLNLKFLSGGNAGECILKSVLCINIGANDLVNLPDLCIARDELGVSIDSRGWLYAVGGFGSSLKTCLRSVELFDPHSGEWKVIAEMKCARRGCSTVIIEDCLYVVGGFDGEAYIQELEM